MNYNINICYLETLIKVKCVNKKTSEWHKKRVKRSKQLVFAILTFIRLTPRFSSDPNSYFLLDGRKDNSSLVSPKCPSKTASST